MASQNKIEGSLTMLKQLQKRLRQKQLYSMQAQTVSQPVSNPMPHPSSMRLDVSGATPRTSEQMLLENRNLKKCMYRLMRMNDYLKNQLARQNYYDRKHCFSAKCPEAQEEDSLRMEIQHLKELNREKSKQIYIWESKMQKEYMCRQWEQEEGRRSCWSHARPKSMLNTPIKSVRVGGSKDKKKQKNHSLKSKKTSKVLKRMNNKSCRLCYSLY